MYEQYRADPQSVSEAGRSSSPTTARRCTPTLTVPTALDDDRRLTRRSPRPRRRGPGSGPASTRARPEATSARRGPSGPGDARHPGGAEEDAGEPIRGAGAVIVANMERSLAVPTATSFRNVPAKLLEVNRPVINGYLGRKGSGKVSFTHLIGYAVVRAIADDRAGHEQHLRRGPRRPAARRAQRARQPRPRRRRRQARRQPHAGRAGAARRRHARLRRVPRRLRGARSARSAPTSSASTTSRAPRITLTNPGTIGTVQSVPRLMPGQGVIVGVGTHRLPGRVAGRRRAQPSASSASQGRHRHVARTTTASSRAPSRACS